VLGWGNDEVRVLGHGVAVDTFGSLYVCGSYSTLLPVGVCDFDPGPGEHEMVFGTIWEPATFGETKGHYVSKFSITNEWQWTKTWEGYNGPSDIAVSGTGNVYVAGELTEEIYIKKFYPTGEEVWSHQWGDVYAGTGLLLNIANAITIDETQMGRRGNIYISGSFEGQFDDNTFRGFDFYRLGSVDQTMPEYVCADTPETIRAHFRLATVRIPHPLFEVTDIRSSDKNQTVGADAKVTVAHVTRELWEILGEFHRVLL